MYVVVTFPEPEHSPAIKGLGENMSFGWSYNVDVWNVGWPIRVQLLQ